jgi:hypothetical protein
VYIGTTISIQERLRGQCGLRIGKAVQRTRWYVRYREGRCWIMEVNAACEVLGGSIIDHICAVDVVLWELGLIVPIIMTVMGVRGQVIMISGEGWHF